MQNSHDDLKPKPRRIMKYPRLEARVIQRLDHLPEVARRAADTVNEENRNPIWIIGLKKIDTRAGLLEIGMIERADLSRGKLDGTFLGCTLLVGIWSDA